jgi:IclR family transcriptional regulator, acetate operon repressor
MNQKSGTEHGADGGEAEAGTAVEKCLALLKLVSHDRGNTPLSELAEQMGLPYSTVRRFILQLERSGMVERVARGRYSAGPALADMAATTVPRERLCNFARLPVRQLSVRTGTVAHLGVLDRDMVTYLLKEGEAPGRVATSPGIQFEAYCTAIGKVLLANLPEAARERYLREGDFVELTPRTMTSAGDLRADLKLTDERGYARDNAEMFEGLHCLAVSVRCGPDSFAAVSISRQPGGDVRTRLSTDLTALKQCAKAIEKRVSDASGIRLGAADN